MILLAILILFFCAAILLGFAYVFIDKNRYLSFMKRYAMFYGVDITKIPSNPMVSDPLKPLVRQGQIGGIVFILLGIFTFGVGIFLLRYI